MTKETKIEEHLKKAREELREMSLGWISGGCDEELCIKDWDKCWDKYFKIK